MKEEITKQSPGNEKDRLSESRHREAVLTETGKALRAISMYPPRHPQRANMLGQAFGGIQVILHMVGDLSFQVGRNHFLYDDVKMGATQPLIQELANEMHLRQVKSFSLRKELSVDDFTSFLEMLMQDPERFRKGRFIERWIQEREMRTVWVNEIDFNRVAAMAGPEEEAQEEGPELVDSRIEEVLAELDRETDPDRFTHLLREIEVIARPLIEEQSYDHAWKILAAVSSHATEEMRPGPGNTQVRAMAQKSVRTLNVGDFLSHLLSWYARAVADEKAPLERVFKLTGVSVIDEVLNVIAGKEAVSAYKPLVKLALSYGDRAKSPLVSALGGEDPARVRKALYLLGELRHKDTTEAIRPFIYHDDPRVKKEAVRALTKIKGIESSRALISALSQVENRDTQILISSALGESKDLAAVPALIKLLKKKPVREETVPLLEAVIESLGRIGSREALPHLIKQLNRFSLINRAPRLRLRIKAAEALGRLGGESAIQALARYAGEGDDPLQVTCTAVLEGLLENEGRPVENNPEQKR